MLLAILALACTPQDHAPEPEQGTRDEAGIWADGLDGDGLFADWQRAARLPHPVVGGTAAQLPEGLVVIGGDLQAEPDTTEDSTTQELDPTLAYLLDEDLWIDLPEVIVPAEGASLLAHEDGRIQVHGGLSQWGYLDPLTSVLDLPAVVAGEDDRWIIACSSDQRYGHGAVLVDGEAFYLGGVGTEDEALPTVLKSNFWGNEESAQEDLLGAGPTLAVAQEGEVRAVVGQSVYTAQVSQDHLRDWELAGTLPAAVEGAALVTWGDRLYLLGGSHDGELSDVILGADFDSPERWEAQGRLPRLMRDHVAAVDPVTGRLSIAGGTGLDDRRHLDVWTVELAELSAD